MDQSQEINFEADEENKEEGIDSDEEEEERFQLPESIVSRLRLNNDFANVHTAYHEFDELGDDLRSRKEKR